MRCVSRLLLMVAVLLAPPLAAAGQAAVEGDAGQAFSRWLAAFNSGDRADMEAFRQTYRFERTVDGDLALRKDMGPFTLLQVDEQGATAMQALLRSEPTDRGLLATVKLHPERPHDIAFFQLEGAELPAQFQPTRLSWPELVAASRQRLAAAQAADTLAGVVLVAHQGQVMLDWHGGLADRQEGVPVSASTQFRLASLNKMFTAVAILQLQQAGRLSLDDTLGHLLPDYPNRAVADSVTVRQLLNHTAGLGDVFGEAFERESSTLRTLKDYWRLAGQQAPGFAPGSEDGYSNYGYILLGNVIEAVSGMDYYRYVQQHIYDVAGMSATGSLPESDVVPRRAQAYTQVQGQWQRETKTLPWRGTSAGGGYSTAGDLLRFARALQRGTLLSPATLALATSAQNYKAWYGFGFMVGGQGPARQFGHEGGAPGANAAFVVLPEQDIVVIGLSNHDPAAMENEVNFLVHRLPLAPMRSGDEVLP